MATQNQNTHGETMPLPAADWSSLFPDLVIRIGDVFLAAGDVDYYMSFRAICRSWRAATDDPRGLSRCFQPHRWVMLDDLDDLDDLSCHTDSRLFLNVDTGRILWKDMPLLNNCYTYIGADDGLLVFQVRHMMHGYDICILNPFTGFMVCFPTSWSHDDICSSVAMGSGVTSSLLFIFTSCDGVCYDSSNPSPQWFMDDSDIASSLCTVVSFQGRVYGANRSGSVVVVDRVDGHTNSEITTIIHTNGELGQSFLVENAGELLLVRVSYKFPQEHMHVFRVDLEVKALNPVKTVGNRAIFLGRRCCLSVNANRLHAIEGNCIYHFQNDIGVSRMYQCHLGDDKHEFLAVRPLDRPLSLPQVIMEHCRGDWF